LKKEKFKEITKRDNFDQVMENINLLIAEGFRIKINVVLMRGQNEEEVIDFIEWTKNKNIHVRFIEFMPFDGNQWRWDRIISYSQILETVKSRFSIQKLKDAKHATTKAFRVDGFQGTFAVISSMTNHFCGTCNRLRLTADGKMKNCLFSNNEVDLLTPYRKGIDIKPLIFDCVKKKNARHGGIAELETLDPNGSEMSERSMILIGG
jgi:cyclic pyranopterin phosphate synthase